MKVITLPDLHEKTDGLDALTNTLARADLVLLPGDLANGNGVRGAAQVLNRVRSYNPRVLAIPGNWDDPATSEMLTRENVNVHRRFVVHNDFAFAGVGGALPSHQRSTMQEREQELAHALNESIAGLDPLIPLVLLCHHPPIHTRVDLAKSNKHVGSVAVREFIERVQPLICFTGHIHEGAGIDRIGRTLIVNPGPLWEGWYASAEILRGHVRARCHRILPKDIAD